MLQQHSRRLAAKPSPLSTASQCSFPAGTSALTQTTTTMLTQSTSSQSWISTAERWLLFQLCPSLPYKALQHAPCWRRFPAVTSPHPSCPMPSLPCLLVCMQVVHVDKPFGDAPPKVPSLNVNYHRCAAHVHA